MMLEFQYTTYMLPLLAVAVISGALAVYYLLGRKSPGAYFLAGLSIAIFIWSAGYALEVSAVHLAAKRLWGKLQYPGIATAPLFWFAFILDYTGHRSFISRRSFTLFLGIPIITCILVFTNDMHGLIWRTTVLEQTGDVLLMKVTHGTWFWIYVFYGYSLLLTGSVLVFRTLTHTSKLYRRQGIMLVTAIAGPLIGNLLYILGLNPLHPLDFTPFAFAVSLIAFASGTLKYGLINLFPIARDRLVENLNSGMLVVDINGRLVDINQIAQEMLGIRSKEVMGKQVEEALSPWPELTRLCAGDTSTLRSTVSIVDASAERNLEVNVSPLRGTHEGVGHLGLVFILHDVTERHEIEEALRESENRNRAMVNAIPDLMFVHDKDGTIIDYHASNPDMLVVPPEEFLGKCLTDALPAEVSSAATNVLKVVLSTQQLQTYMYDISVAGRLRHFETRMVPYGADKILSIVRDISDQKELEAQLLQAQKMEAIGQLTGGIAHDFNNLLQVITGYTALADDDLESDNPVRTYLDEITAASSRATSLVSQLLLFSRRQIIQPEPLDLNAVVADILKMLQRIIGEHIRLTWHPAADAGTIYADRNMVEQSVINLCVNARDSMPEGGELLIRTEDTIVDTSVGIAQTELAPGHYTLLSITDTGCGMDDDTRTHAFEPFFSTKPMDKGSGLGLSTVYGIIKQHQGSITIDSTPGDGTRVNLYWPVHGAELRRA